MSLTVSTELKTIVMIVGKDQSALKFSFFLQNSPLQDPIKSLSLHANKSAITHMISLQI